jgi:hypothetical protein
VLIVIISEEFFAKRLSPVPALKQNLGGYIFKDDREVERWL